MPQVNRLTVPVHNLQYFSIYLSDFIDTKKEIVIYDHCKKLDHQHNILYKYELSIIRMKKNQMHNRICKSAIAKYKFDLIVRKIVKQNMLKHASFSS